MTPEETRTVDRVSRAVVVAMDASTEEVFNAFRGLLARAAIETATMVVDVLRGEQPLPDAPDEDDQLKAGFNSDDGGSDDRVKALFSAAATPPPPAPVARKPLVPNGCELVYEAYASKMLEKMEEEKGAIGDELAAIARPVVDRTGDDAVGRAFFDVIARAQAERIEAFAWLLKKLDEQMPLEADTLYLSETCEGTDCEHFKPAHCTQPGTAAA